MPNDPCDETKYPYQGMCAGGPRDGECMSARVPRINIPIINPKNPCIMASYEFNEDIRMWIWTGSANF